MSPIKTMVVKLKDNHYVSFNVAFEVAADTPEPDFAGLKEKIREAIIKIISGKGSEELKKPAVREALRLEILQAVNSLLRQGTVKQVYYSEFLIQ